MFRDLKESRVSSPGLGVSGMFHELAERSFLGI